MYAQTTPRHTHIQRERERKKISLQLKCLITLMPRSNQTFNRQRKSLDFSAIVSHCLCCLCFFFAFIIYYSIFLLLFIIVKKAFFEFINVHNNAFNLMKLLLWHNLLCIFPTIIDRILLWRFFVWHIHYKNICQNKKNTINDERRNKKTRNCSILKLMYKNIFKVLISIDHNNFLLLIKPVVFTPISI